MTATTKLVNKVGGTNNQRKTYEVHQTSDGKSFVARLVRFQASDTQGPWSDPFDTEAEAIKHAWKLWAAPIIKRQQADADYRAAGGY